MNLSDLKSNEEYLFAVLNQTKTGQHLKCPFHKDDHGSMSIWNRNNIWFWKCHAGCGSGTIIDAVQRKYGITKTIDAIRKLESEMGVSIIKDTDVNEPILNQEKAFKFISDCHKTLMQDFEIQEKYMLSKRNIDNFDIIKKYQIGFARYIRFKRWKSWKIFGWVLPILDENHNLLAIKLHLEKRLRTQPKCCWAPFGTYPKNKPVNGLSTLFPPPEDFNSRYIILCPGELKALALVAAGFPATSPTVGESKLRPFIVNRLLKLKFDKIYINFDNDTTGRKWRDTVKSLLQKESNIPIFTFDFSQDIKNAIEYKETETETQINEDELDEKWENILNEYDFAPKEVFKNPYLKKLNTYYDEYRDLHLSSLTEMNKYRINKLEIKMKDIWYNLNIEEKKDFLGPEINIK